MRKNINPHFVSVFVYHIVYKSITGRLAYASAMSLSQTFYRIHTGEITPDIANAVACPLLCVLSGLQYTRLKQPITSRASLNLALKDIRNLFSFADESDEPLDVREQARKFLEHNLENARMDGLAALDEALAGFPVSGGDLALWEEHRLTSAAEQAVVNSLPAGALK